MQRFLQTFGALLLLFSTANASSVAESNQYDVKATIPLHVEVASEKRALPPETYGYGFVGCFDELQSPSKLLNHAVQWDQKSVSSCVSACFSSGPLEAPFSGHYMFAAVVNGTQCVCDNALSFKAVSINQNYCSSKCRNGPSEYCGGTTQYQLYFLSDVGVSPLSINPTHPSTVGIGHGKYDYVGCYVDSSSNRQLKGASYSGPEMIPSVCAHFCWSKNFPYAGTEFGAECYCGSSLTTPNGGAPDVDCSQTCAHDSTQLCGASNRISVYRAAGNLRD